MPRRSSCRSRHAQQCRRASFVCSPCSLDISFRARYLSPYERDQYAVRSLIRYQPEVLNDLSFPNYGEDACDGTAGFSHLVRVCELACDFLKPQIHHSALLYAELTKKLGSAHLSYFTNVHCASLVTASQADQLVPRDKESV